MNIDSLSEYIYSKLSSVLDITLANRVIYVTFMCQFLTFRTGLLFERRNWQKYTNFLKGYFNTNVRML